MSLRMSRSIVSKVRGGVEHAAVADIGHHVDLEVVRGVGFAIGLVAGGICGGHGDNMWWDGAAAQDRSGTRIALIRRKKRTYSVIWPSRNCNVRTVGFSHNPLFRRCSVRHSAQSRRARRRIYYYLANRGIRYGQTKPCTYSYPTTAAWAVFLFTTIIGPARPRQPSKAARAPAGR